MNQHITKLVRQALKESVSTPVESVVASRINDHGIVEIPNTFAEKFAELIVEECVSLMEWQKISPKDDGAYNSALSLAQRNIKEQFGVEE